MPLRTITTLLVVLQMLVPPGMCVCQVVPHAGAPGHDDGEEAHHASCCGCREVETAPPAPGHGPVDPAAPARPSHLPSCPALLPADHAKLVKPSDPLLLLADLRAGPAPVTVPPPGAPLSSDPDPGPAGQRLYLTFRALLL